MTTTLESIFARFGGKLSRQLIRLLLIEIVFLIVTFFSPEMLLWVDQSPRLVGNGLGGFLALAWLLFCGVPLYWMVPALRIAFHAHPHRRCRVTLVLFTYVSSTLMLGSFYFICCCISDLKRAEDHLRAFQVEYDMGRHDFYTGGVRDELIKSGEAENPTPYFRGISSRVVVGLLDKEYGFHDQGTPWHEHKTLKDFIAAKEAGKFSTARINWLDRFPLLFETWHFSVVTAATVGYGEILPGNGFMRFVVDLQILGSTALLVLGLALAISGPEGHSDNKT